MPEKYVLVEYISSVSNVLAQTFQSMQRIKLTCFDVSNNYIVFGASSGGIYIFTREPCEFIKLIPSKEGSATNILISPNEKKIAISSSKGLIVILENIFDLNYDVYSEHEGQIITALKWHNDDLFCGDNNGKISLTNTTNLLAKAIFQSPSTSLMHLDSCIVQIDCFSKYLLMSTQTRAYFCDTDLQQYRQIGKKLRDGNFGAVFFNTPSNLDLETITHNRGLFQTGEHVNFGSCNIDAKIYCGRPGARLWEVNFEATVLKTHQFRSSFGNPPSDIVHVGDKLDERINISKFTKDKNLVEDFNFGRILNISNKFILTYDKDCIFVFNPIESNLVFWTNSLKNIRDIRIVNSFIYIWRDSLQINVLSITNLEDLVLQTLKEKHYYLCTELCLYYSKDLYNMLESSKKLYLLTSLKSKLLELNEMDLMEKIEPMLLRIKELSSNKIKSNKLNNGIVYIDNSYPTDLIPESVENFVPSTSTKAKEAVDNNIKIYTMYKQYKLHQTHKNVDIPDFCKIFESTSIFSTIEKFIQYVKDEHDVDCKLWCQEQCLKQFSKGDFCLDDFNPDFKAFLREGFLELNVENAELTCKCNFPIPNLHNCIPKYYKLGVTLLENEEDYIIRLPYMYKNKLGNIRNFNDLQKNLPLLLQFSDLDILKCHVSNFTYDVWDDTIKHIITLKKGKCLNCGKPINAESALTWSQLGLLMVQSIGPENTTKLFKRYAKFIANGELDAKFYQACIFASVAKVGFNNKQINFLDEVLNSNSSCEFEKNMNTYLRNKYLGKFSLPMACTSTNKIPNCHYCNLPMNTPIINNPSRLICGHIFHTLCLSHNNNKCNICNHSEYNKVTI
ncbi:unnamed protein product [Brassicogethes aeneus]|uniref:RING-type domain-containing protein n=1 Tax=Brassicogethes aeneus TaxID=1431903 RepID=A0A9P0BDW7_BRAAE|nr:unnamed protein product [Brassicogethes aeneus]